MITRTTIEIELTEGIPGEDQDRILMIPWTPPSPYRRREIIQGEGDQSSAMRPVRTKARAILIEAHVMRIERSLALASGERFGRLPRGFGAKRLMDLPMAWSDQWSVLGLKASAEP